MIELFLREPGAAAHKEALQRQNFSAPPGQGGIAVDRRFAPAHYAVVVTLRFAPEVRGEKRFQAVAAPCCAVAVFCCLLVPWRAPAAAELQPVATTRQLTFTLPDVAGAAVVLESARGRAVLVHFFATWCEPCREELPALERLALRARGAVNVLAIAVAEPDRRVQKFLETTPVDFPVLLDRDRAVAKAWHVVSLPTSFVLDADLNAKFVVESDYAWDAVDADTLAGASAMAAGGFTAIKPISKRDSGG